MDQKAKNKDGMLRAIGRINKTTSTHCRHSSHIYGNGSGSSLGWSLPLPRRVLSNASTTSTSSEGGRTTATAASYTNTNTSGNSGNSGSSGGRAGKAGTRGINLIHIGTATIIAIPLALAIMVSHGLVPLTSIISSYHIISYHIISFLIISYRMPSPLHLV
jgi:hypothetical protein